MNRRTLKRRRKATRRMTRGGQALAAISAGTFALAATAGSAGAATQTYLVTDNQIHDGNPPAAQNNDWYRADTRPGGGVGLVSDPSFGINPLAPPGFGNSSLYLSTNQTNTAKAQLLTTRFWNTPLAQVTSLEYWTYQSADHTGFAQGLPSYQLAIDGDGNLSTTNDRTNLVYEPYQDANTTQSVAQGTWQNWIASVGTWWSSHTITCANGTIAGSPGGPANISLADVKTACPTAAVLAIGVDVGSFNPNYVTAVDGLVFQTLSDRHVFNFERK